METFNIWLLSILLKQYFTQKLLLINLMTITPSFTQPQAILGV